MAADSIVDILPSATFLQRITDAVIGTRDALTAVLDGNSPLERVSHDWSAGRSRVGVLLDDQAVNGDVATAVPGVVVEAMLAVMGREEVGPATMPLSPSQSLLFRHFIQEVENCISDPYAFDIGLHRLWLAERPTGQSINWQGRVIPPGSLGGLDLRRAILSGSTYSGSLEETRLDGAELTGAKWMRCHGDFVSFRGAVLLGADLSGLQGNRICFDDALVDGTTLSGCRLSEPSFRRLTLTGTKLERNVILSPVVEQTLMPGLDAGSRWNDTPAETSPEFIDVLPALDVSLETDHAPPPG